MATTPDNQDEFQSNSTTPDGLIKLGVAAMDRKARSKPMRNILSRLIATGKFEITVFGDKVILDEDIENWPTCDFLISFYSDGFPIDKAIEFVKLRKPICVNDLPLQKIFWDRRIVLQILDKIGVPTSPRLVLHRDGGPTLDSEIAAIIQQSFGIRLEEKPMSTSKMIDDDTIEVDGKLMRKPFVEKPVSGEDHNVNIYFKTADGGGARRLFRKIGNQSSAYEPDMVATRGEGSYVYEEFIDVDNAEDVKVYTLGPTFVHAETRKSPVVDGVVRRNNEGKEIRFICQLTDAEKKMARDISVAFKQNICGFDLLRANGKSYVIDVNGWSFVKGNDFYYEKCAEMLTKFCEQRMPSVPKTLVPQSGFESPNLSKSWTLKSVICVARHGDRTPKCKLKFAFKGKDAWSAPFITLLQGRTSEIILRDPNQLQFIADAAVEACEIEGSNPEQLGQLKMIIEKKKTQPGTKAQLKPSFVDEKLEKLVIVVKWGGEFTHAARYQARDLGENMRKDYVIMNKALLDHTHISTSSERRVIATAELFGSAFLDGRHPPGEITRSLTIRKDLLDDSNAAKEETDNVKKRLKLLCRSGPRPEFGWKDKEHPYEVVKETIELMKYHRALMNENWGKLDVENIQPRWCCGEYPFLFRERWDGLFKDWCDVEIEKFDPSRVSELYDSLKYDSLHNRVFLETIFNKSPSTVPSRPGTSQSYTTEAGTITRHGSMVGLNELKERPRKLHELYRRAKILFDLIAPQEYGIERSEKEDIGLLTSLPLLEEVITNLKAARTNDHGSVNFYFTKESHIHTLVNLVKLSDLPITMPHVPELDYMSYITFEVFERTNAGGTELSMRVSLSPGAHSDLLDASLDAKHALQVQPRRALTGYIKLDEAIEILSRHSARAVERGFKKSTTKIEGMLEFDLPIEGDEIYAGATRRFQEIRQYTTKKARSLYSGSSDRGD